MRLCFTHRWRCNRRSVEQRENSSNNNNNNNRSQPAPPPTANLLTSPSPFFLFLLLLLLSPFAFLSFSLLPLLFGFLSANISVRLPPPPTATHRHPPPPTATHRPIQIEISSIDYFISISIDRDDPNPIGLTDFHSLFRPGRGLNIDYSRQREQKKRKNQLIELIPGRYFPSSIDI